ncbi:MAG: M23 family metallopeptidase, partial [Acidobacteria bacterium]|nr:M23 family metallopeptidase [Acidobacteriota bacterium]
TALELLLPWLPRLSILPIYLVMYVLVSAAIRSVQRQTSVSGPGFDDESDLDRPQRPIAGPIGRFGPYGLMATFYSSQLLCLFNPFQVAELVQQATGNAALVGREKRSGDDGRGYRTQVAYTLPFDGEWFVANGGATPKTSHSWDILGQRFALDFVQADDAFRTHAGRGTKAKEYFCYGREICAAADGTAVAVEDRVRQAFLGWGVCDFTARSFLGNHVLVKHAEGEFALYAHLVRGSVTVAPGDRVDRGQVLGRCGHTGHSTEPHLHFHLQDSADLFRGMGLPVRFSHLFVDGKAAARVLLRAGNRVQSQPGSP